LFYTLIGDVDDISKLFLTTIVKFLYFILNAIAIFVLAIMGMYMYTTKVLCVGGLANWWFKAWTGNDDHEMVEAIDTEILNESIYVEIMLETLPQVVIQIYNNYMLDPDVAQWNPISILSLTITFMNTLNGVYRFFYFKFFKHVNLTTIPVSMIVLGFVLFEAPLTNHGELMKENIALREQNELEMQELQAKEKGGEGDPDASNANEMSAEQIRAGSSVTPSTGGDDDEDDHHLAWSDNHGSIAAILIEHRNEVDHLHQEVSDLHKEVSDRDQVHTCMIFRVLALSLYCWYLVKC